MRQEQNTMRENKPPGPVTWIGYLAAALLLALPLAVLTVRSGAWQQGLLLYALACLGAALLLVILLILLLLPRYAPWRGAILGRAALALPGTLLLFSLLADRGDHPPIHDITTDTADPPVFTAAATVRGPEANPLDIDPQVIGQQQAAYPELDTLVTPLSIDEAFDRALAVAMDLGWEIYHQDRDAGVIEAADTTPIMGFSDDIVIRVRSSAGGTRLDLRSVSRVGIGDLGANARRIRTFQQAFQQ
jgi:uncharacterized protein (DUF1499 family)